MYVCMYVCMYPNSFWRSTIRFTDLDFLQKSEKMCKRDIFVNFGTITKKGNLETKQVTQFFHQLVESDILSSF